MPQTEFYSDIVINGNRVREAADSAVGTDYVTKDEMDAAIGVIATQKFSMSIGDGVATTFVVNHNMDTRDVVVEVYDNATWVTVYAQVVRTDVNNVTVDFNVPPPVPDAYRVVVIG